MESKQKRGGLKFIKFASCFDVRSRKNKTLELYMHLECKPYLKRHNKSAAGIWMLSVPIQNKYNAKASFNDKQNSVHLLGAYHWIQMAKEVYLESKTISSNQQDSAKDIPRGIDTYCIKISITRNETILGNYFFRCWFVGFMRYGSDAWFKTNLNLL